VLVIEFEFVVVDDLHVDDGLVERVEFDRRAEDGPDGLHHPEEPREQLLHHRGQREFRRRDRRPADARRDRDGD
jgi:hypothetical protein